MHLTSYLLNCVIFFVFSRFSLKIAEVPAQDLIKPSHVSVGQHRLHFAWIYCLKRFQPKFFILKNALLEITLFVWFILKSGTASSI